MNYDFNILDNILNSSKNKIFGLLNEFSHYITESRALLKDYDINNNYNFNIFSSISDIYYRENLHSDIIKLILDPVTEKIGNKENIKIFIGLLNKIKPELKINIGEDIKIEREKGRIDLLIYDTKNNSIIIENKINYAVDRDDQLGRYYNIAKDKGLTVKAIVYLPLSPEKELDINYSIKDSELRESIKHLIIPLPIIDKKNKVNFADDFIGKCINQSEKDIAKVYYSEYQELLKSLGGNMMTMTLDRDTLIEIYSNKEKLDSFNSFGSLWEKREEVFQGIIRDLLKENDFLEHPDDPKKILYFKIDDNISLGYDVNNWDFGFTITPNGKEFTKKTKDDLKVILENKKLKDIFSKEPTKYDELWVYKTLDIDKIGDCKCIIYNFNELKKLINDNTKAGKERHKRL